MFLWRAGLALLGSWLPRSTPLLNGADGVLFVLYISWALAVCFWPPVPGVRAFSVLMLRIVLTQIAIASLSAYGLRFLVRWLSG